MRALAAVLLGLVVLEVAAAYSLFKEAQDELDAAVADGNHHGYFSFNEQFAPAKDSKAAKIDDLLSEMERRQQIIDMKKAKIFSSLSRLQHYHRPPQQQQPPAATTTTTTSRITRRSHAFTKPAKCHGCCEVVYNAANRRDIGLLLQYQSSPDKHKYVVQVVKIANSSSDVSKPLNYTTMKDEMICDSILNARLVFKVFSGQDVAAVADQPPSSPAPNKKPVLLLDTKARPGLDVKDTFRALSQRNDNIVVHVREDCSKTGHAFVVQQIKDESSSSPMFRLYSSGSAYRLVDFLSGFPADMYKGPAVVNKKRIFAVAGNSAVPRSTILKWFDSMIDMFEVATENSKKFKPGTAEAFFLNFWGKKTFTDKDNKPRLAKCLVYVTAAKYSNEDCTQNFDRFFNPLSEALNLANRELRAVASAPIPPADFTKRGK